MTDIAKEQLEESKQNIAKLEEEIKILLIPKDPDDSKNVVMEIRAGTGGDEASIFAGDLYRMYTKFCQEMKWKTSLVDLLWQGTPCGSTKCRSVRYIYVCLLYTSDAADE